MSLNQDTHASARIFENEHETIATKTLHKISYICYKTQNADAVETMSPSVPETHPSRTKIAKWKTRRNTKNKMTAGESFQASRAKHNFWLDKIVSENRLKLWGNLQLQQRIRESYPAESKRKQSQKYENHKLEGAHHFWPKLILC